MSRLDETRRETLTMLQGIDLSRQVYPKPPWRGQDVIGHISLWEIEAAKSLQAHTQGREYVTEWPSDDEDAFNNAAADARRAWSITQIMDEFASAREDMKAALRALPADKLTGIMMCQWGERGNVPFLIEEMIMHEIEHRDHIVKALHAP
jgi:hypothetical protein